MYIIIQYDIYNNVYITSTTEKALVNLLNKVGPSC